MDKAEIQDHVVGVLRELTDEWELDLDDGIGPSTLLMGDLSFESIDVVQFAVALEKRFAQTGLPFEQLFMHDGEYVEDLSVKQVVEFLDGQLAS